MNPRPRFRRKLRNNGSGGEHGALIAPLTKAVDAIEVITDGLDIDQVIAKIISLYERLS